MKSPFKVNGGAKFGLRQKRGSLEASKKAYTLELKGGGWSSELPRQMGRSPWVGENPPQPKKTEVTRCGGDRRQDGEKLSKNRMIVVRRDYLHCRKRRKTFA